MINKTLPPAKNQEEQISLKFVQTAIYNISKSAKKSQNLTSPRKLFTAIANDLQEKKNQFAFSIEKRVKLKLRVWYSLVFVIAV